MTENERKTMMILADTINGEINRMCVTKDLSELDTMYGHAKKNLDKLSKMIYDARFRAENRMADLIDRQATIDAILKGTAFQSVRDLYEYAEDRCDERAGGVVDAIDAVIAVPSAQPEIVRCNECKYYQGAYGAMGHAPCSYWNSDGVMWDWYCSRGEKYELFNQQTGRD